MNDLVYDEKIVVSLPETVTPEGAKAVENSLYYNLGWTPPVGFSWEWKNKSGRFATRVAKQFKKDRGIDLDADQRNGIADCWKACMLPEQSFTIDLTRDFRWHHGEFGDGGSCYWGIKSAARVMIENANGFAMRFYKNDKGIGRTWCIQNKGIYYLFNAYGYTLLESGRILQKLTDATYRGNVELRNGGRWDGTLHINKGNGVAVGNERPPAMIDFKIDRPEYVRFCDRCLHPYDYDNGLFRLCHRCRATPMTNPI